MSRRAGGCAPEIPTGQAERINAVHRGHQMRRAICGGRVPRHLTPVDIRCMHYIASCAPPSAAIRLPAEYFFPSPCSLKSVSRPEVHTLRSTIRPRQAPCSCRLCQRVVREGHLSVLAPNREVLVMSPFLVSLLIYPPRPPGHYRCTARVCNSVVWWVSGILCMGVHFDPTAHTADGRTARLDLGVCTRPSQHSGDLLGRRRRRREGGGRRQAFHLAAAEAPLVPQPS